MLPKNKGKGCALIGILAVPALEESSQASREAKISISGSSRIAQGREHRGEISLINSTVSRLVKRSGEKDTLCLKSMSKTMSVLSSMTNPNRGRILL